MNGPSPEPLASQTPAEIGSFGSFIGRERQLLEVEGRLHNNRIVTVVGPGGMGKTRLAIEIILRKSRDTTGVAEIAFISFESLTDSSEGAVLDAMIIGLKLNPGAAGGRREALVQRLNRTSLILVLDNCETARSEIAPIVRDLLSECPQLRVLATSQHQLGLGGGLEMVYELPPLSVPDERPGSLDALHELESYELFVTRAQMAIASWTPEKGSLQSLRRILQLTDGIPLAIEIIVAWVPILSLAQICEDLDQTPFAGVTALDEYSSIASERHRSMLRCLEWSFRHLSKTSPKEAEGFKRLGVFAGRFTEEAVGNVCEVEAPRELLSRLVKMSLVHPCLGTDPRRYSMLHFTRAFAQEKARSMGIEQRLIEHHVDFFAKLVSQPNDEGDWESEPLVSFQHEWLDFVTAANAAHVIGNFQAVWRISRALGPFLLKHGLWSERERLNRDAVNAASRSRARGALERALIDVGIVLEAQGRWPESAHQYKLSLVSANKHDRPNPVHQAMALQRLGAILTRMGDAAGAERARRKLSKITPLLDQPRAKARSLDEEGQMLAGHGDLSTAEAKYREALKIRESIGDDSGIARSRGNLGTILTLRCVWNDAEDELRKSLNFWMSQKMDQESAIVMHLLADLFRRQGRYPEARDCCERSLKCRENDPKGQAVTLSLLARILRVQRDFVNALVASRQNRELCRLLGDAEGESIALDDIGTAYALQRQWDEALTSFNESLRLKESGTRRDIVGLAITLDRIAQIHARCGHWAQARAAYTESLKCSQEAGRHITAAITLINVAMVQAAQGQKQTALTTLDDAIASLETQQSGKAVLVEARKQRLQLDRKMREGSPWTHWRDAAFKNQQLFVRKRFNDERRAKRWKEVAIGYDILAKEFIESGQQMEAGLALNELGAAYRHLGEFVRSEEVLRKALAIFEEVTLPLGKAASWHKLGDLFADQQLWQQAGAAFCESIKIKVEGSDDDGEGISQDALASVLIKDGRFVEAECAADRAWEIFSQHGSAWQRWHPLIRILWLKVEQRSPSDAKAVAVRLAEAVQGNLELEVAASELRAMTEAEDWDGIKARLAQDGIVGPGEALAPTEDNHLMLQMSKQPCLLVVATEWDSKHGGLSTFNRDLCAALASAGALVVCYVQEASFGEIERAKGLKIELVEAPMMLVPRLDAMLFQRPRLPLGFVPDIIVGHDRITGAASVALLRDHFPGSRRVLFIHTSPEEIEWHKEPREDSTGAARAAVRKREQLGLANGCDLVVAVGPHLASEFGTDLHGAGNAVTVMELTPGLPERPANPSATLPPSIRCLILGRVEDYQLKGLDLAAKALGRVIANWKQGNAPKLVVRGAPVGTDAALRERLSKDSAPTELDIVIRHYSSDETEIRNDLREASLVLMPSKKEGFGLVGLEAIACGIPTLISASSGLAESVSFHAPQLAGEWILSVTGDAITKWAERIELILTGREGAFARADALCEQLAGKLSWKRSADELLQRLAAPKP